MTIVLFLKQNEASNYVSILSPPPNSAAVRRPDGSHLLLQLRADAGAAAGERL